MSCLHPPLLARGALRRGDLLQLARAARAREEVGIGGEGGARAGARLEGEARAGVEVEGEAWRGRGRGALSLTAAFAAWRSREGGLFLDPGMRQVLDCSRHRSTRDELTPPPPPLPLPPPLCPCLSLSLYLCPCRCPSRCRCPD